MSNRTLESSGVQVIKDNLLHLLVNFLLLAKDDIALTFDGIAVQGRVLKNVCEDLNRLGDVRLEGLCVVDGLFARGVCVQVSAQILNLELNIVLIAVVGTLR
jgi:hypothetical protein